MQATGSKAQRSAAVPFTLSRCCAARCVAALQRTAQQRQQREAQRRNATRSVCENVPLHTYGIEYTGHFSKLTVLNASLILSSLLIIYLLLMTLLNVVRNSFIELVFPVIILCIFCRIAVNVLKLLFFLISFLVKYFRVCCRI